MRQTTLAVTNTLRYTETMSEDTRKKRTPKTTQVPDFQPTKISLQVAALAVLSLVMLALIVVLL